MQLRPLVEGAFWIECPFMKPARCLFAALGPVVRKIKMRFERLVAASLFEQFMAHRRFDSPEPVALVFGKRKLCESLPIAHSSVRATPKLHDQ